MTEIPHRTGSERAAPPLLRVGDWCVDPASGDISRNGETARLEARTLRLLIYMTEHPGEIVSIDTLLDHAWNGVSVTPDSVYQAVASLRRQLGDDPKQPAYIATVPRLGYRMVAPVSPYLKAPGEDHTATPPPSGPIPDLTRGGGPPPASARRTRGFLLAVIAILGLAFVAVYLVQGRLAKQRAATSAAAAVLQNSVAVLPFLDLTPGMKNEEFADGITEELIDKLSKVPGLQVTPPTSSFYFKGKQVPVADIARSLHVAYALDGILRKSGAWVRVDVRLIRAGNGFIVWSETYDQPMSDILTIQDDIAGKVTKALLQSITTTNPSASH
jgi:TolB-like protein/DNA-binding winged helix-turn-helix (wHTH) protein